MAGASPHHRRCLELAALVRVVVKDGPLVPPGLSGTFHVYEPFQLDLCQARSSASIVVVLRSTPNAMMISNSFGSADHDDRMPSKWSSAILVIIIPRKTKGIDRQKIVHHRRIFATRQPPRIRLKIIPKTKPTIGRTKAVARPKIRLWRCSLIIRNSYTCIFRSQMSQNHMRT